MDVLNEVIGAVVADMPPARDIDDDATQMRKRPISDTHAFTDANQEGGRRMTRLPPPEQWVLCKMNEMEVAEMIEQHIDFYTVDKDGSERSVHLPDAIRAAFHATRTTVRCRQRVAYATMPLVLADGNLLAPEGLDRLRGIQFIIPDELRAVVPQPQDCTPERVKAAMEFLCNEWLVDVATDGTGKALLIAAALTPDRALAAGEPAVLLRHRRPARQWQDHGDLSC